MKKKYSIKHTLIHLLLIGLFLTSFSGLKAQEYSTIAVSTELFMSIQGLDQQMYGDIVKAARTRTDFSVRSACVPANIIMFDIAENNTKTLAENFETIKGLILQVTSLTEVNLVVGYSEEVFLKKCHEFRELRR